VRVAVIRSNSSAARQAYRKHPLHPVIMTASAEVAIRSFRPADRPAEIDGMGRALD
jgi:hypothetical protein